jgi:hypothetical protein
MFDTDHWRSFVRQGSITSLSEKKVSLTFLFISSDEPLYFPATLKSDRKSAALRIYVSGPPNIPNNFNYAYLLERRGFTKLRKANINFAMSVSLSVRVEQLGCYWKDFHEIWYLSIVRNPVEKIQVSLKSEKNKGWFT